jgi:hypothetical protein
MGIVALGAWYVGTTRTAPGAKGWRPTERPVSDPRTGACANHVSRAGRERACPYAGSPRPAVAVDYADAFARAGGCVDGGDLVMTSGHLVAFDPLFHAPR